MGYEGGICFKAKFILNKLKHVLMGNAFQAKYGIRKVLSEMLLKLNNDQ